MKTLIDNVFLETETKSKFMEKATAILGEYRRLKVFKLKSDLSPISVF
ncbi:hypothetical protein H5T51_08910 [Candidatus Bathyarchaeota archaeon]|nr:hypothetical protein [Candidatus Bathyarchaeota archaeon]